MKSFRIFISAFSTIFFLSIGASNPLAHSPQLARRVVAQRRAYVRQLVHGLRQTLQHQPEAKQTVVSGFEQFEHTPGFIAVLEKIAQQAHNAGGVKGHLFEIEKAINLHKRRPRSELALTVLGFGRIRRSPKSEKAREFDIVAQQGAKLFYYECKNTAWRSSTRSNGAQFLDQKEIARDLESNYGVRVNYVVASKEAVPDKWRDFFEKNNITFQEEAK